MESSLLILNYIDIAYIFPKEAVSQVYKELLDLKLENIGNKIQPVYRLLARIQIIGDLWPLQIGYKGNKEGRLIKVANNSHKILK